MMSRRLTNAQYASMLSLVSSLRTPSPIRSLQPLLAIPGMISLGGGLPNPSLFPFKEMQVTLTDGSAINLSGKRIETALQYSPSYGLREFVEALKKIQRREHFASQPTTTTTTEQDWDVLVTTGSQEGVSKAFEMLLNPGDTLITESPTYPAALKILEPFRINIVDVPIDASGLIPEKLEETLEKLHSNRTKVSVLYTIPVGQNPSGVTLSKERRYQIYKIASKYNLLILEDDPYWYLRFPNEDGTLDSLPSFLSIDDEGRVIRFDTFSKILSSGLRLGWVTGPKFLIERLQLHVQSSLLHASGVSQALVLELLEHWNEAGWKDHIFRVSSEYKKRRDIFISLAEKHLAELAEWIVPSAGMFLWLKLKTITNTDDLIRKKAVEKKVLFLPGSDFFPDKKPTPYLRASFSTATPEEMDLALSRLAEIIKETQ